MLAEPPAVTATSWAVAEANPEAATVMVYVEGGSARRSILPHAARRRHTFCSLRLITRNNGRIGDAPTLRVFHNDVQIASGNSLCESDLAKQHSHAQRPAHSQNSHIASPHAEISGASHGQVRSW